MFKFLSSILFVAAFSLTARAQSSVEPSEVGYQELRSFLNERYAVPLGKVCFATVVIPSLDCLIEITPAPSCEKSWAWDQIQISVQAGGQRLTVFPLRADTEAKAAGHDFTFYQYDRESEEGHKTGDRYLKEVVAFTQNTLTVSDYVSHPEWTKKLSCQLSN